MVTRQLERPDWHGQCTGEDCFGLLGRTVCLLSAAALMMVRYEAFVRALWSLNVAIDGQVESACPLRSTSVGGCLQPDCRLMISPSWLSVLFWRPE